jgi:hypothetical protein|tara:strand:+ start:499 stop:2646 length:2148 start_codon:yes stop_codon:yes gene_type:complete
MNDMKRYKLGGIFASVLLIFSIFTLLSISEVNAEEVISVNAKGYENTIIIEFENESASEIKTIKMWLGGDATFKSFKAESDWGYTPDSKLVVFTTTNTLNSGESVKFGLITNEKVTGINWKALDQNNEEIDKRKTTIKEISHTIPSLIEEESEAVEQAKETGSALYGVKKFIPETLRVGSDVRLVGNGFGVEKELKLYLDTTILKSVDTDKQGNFLTTVSIPDSYNAGTSEFIIKDESGNFQSTNINIEEQKNRFLKTTNFEVNSIPAEIRYDETLAFSGNAYPHSAIVISFEDSERNLEKTRVVTANSNGEWVFEEMINRTDVVGEKYVIFKNNQDKTTKNLTIKSDYTIDISASAVRYNIGETVSIIGISESSTNTTIWIKDENKKIVHYDIFTTNPNGELNYEFVVDDKFSSGTYTAIVEQDDGGSDAAVFGIKQYPATSITVLTDKTNFPLESKAILNILGPQSTKLSITILDSNDNVKLTDSITTTPSGKAKYVIDLAGLSSGIYRAAVSATNVQDAAKFSIGLESGSGPISLVTTQDNYSPGESILIIGNTGNGARLTITLYDPSENIISSTETFSDSSGNFSTENIGIPSDGMLGNWKITAHSRLDTKSIEISVSVPLGLGLTLQIDETEYRTGDTVIIKGVGQSDSNRLTVEIINEDDQVVTTLETPITSNGMFSLPWNIPGDFSTGMYTVKVSDAANSDNIEIFIQ